MEFAFSCTQPIYVRETDIFKSKSLQSKHKRVNKLTWAGNLKTVIALFAHIFSPRHRVQGYGYANWKHTSGRSSLPPSIAAALTQCQGQELRKPSSLVANPSFII